MENEKKQFTTIDEYINSFPARVQSKLNEMRAAIKAAAPEATEKISYQMPAYYQKGNLVYFAAFKKHIGFYPTQSGIAAFEDELKGYKGAKGSVQFPMDGPLPIDLIGRITRYRVEENLKKNKK